MGKLLEGCIKSRLVTDGFHHDAQFGFVPGKSAEDAIKSLLDTVKDEPGKYTAVIFLDIKGTFNGAWWPAIADCLRARRISGDLYGIILSYFGNRTIRYQLGDTVEFRILQRGCPQGSKLGPNLWNLLVDGILETINAHPFSKAIAYADDLAIITWGNSRPLLEHRFTILLQELEEWASDNKLEFSVDKCKYLVFGGRLSRNPRAHLGGGYLRRTNTFKYLGLILDEKLTFMYHITDTCNKLKKLFSSLRRTLTSAFRIPSEALHKIYSGAVIPILSYAAFSFRDRLRFRRIQNKLNSLRGYIARAITGAYSTTAIEAVGFLAGIPPLYLVIEAELDKRGYRKGEPFLDINNQPIPVVPRRSRRQVLLTLEHRIIREWQIVWDEADTGRVTHRFFPVIRDIKVYKLSRRCVQFLTGHGQFGSYLFRIGRLETEGCVPCGGDSRDDPEHRLLSCGRYDVGRANLPGVVDLNSDVSQLAEDLYSSNQMHLFESFLD